MLTGERPGALPIAPTVSVVIITRNEGPELQATTSNVLATLPAKHRQVIVVDDDSTDLSTAFLADLPEILVVRSPGHRCCPSPQLWRIAGDRRRDRVRGCAHAHARGMARPVG